MKLARDQDLGPLLWTANPKSLAALLQSSGANHAGLQNLDHIASQPYLFYVKKRAEKDIIWPETTL